MIVFGVMCMYIIDIKRKSKVDHCDWRYLLVSAYPLVVATITCICKPPSAHNNSHQPQLDIQHRHHQCMCQCPSAPGCPAASWQSTCRGKLSSLLPVLCPAELCMACCNNLHPPGFFLLYKS